MASMTSVISLFVLLLVTYSYSKPVGEQYNSSTPEYPFSTDETTVQNGSSSYMGSMSYEVTTGVSDIHHPRSVTDLSDEETTTAGDVTVWSRSVGESESEETTTPDDVTVSARSLRESESEETTTAGDVTVSSRSVGESESEETTTPVDVTVSPRSFVISSFSSSTPSEEEPNFNEFSSTTIESSTSFNQRAIPNYDDQDQFPSSTPYYKQGQEEITGNVQPSSSVTKFGQYSGLISNGQIGQSQYQQQGQRFPQSIGRNQVPVSQVSGQQTGSQFLTQGQQFPQSVGRNQVPVSQVSGQPTGSQFLTQGQRFPQSVGITQGQGGQVYEPSESKLQNQPQGLSQSVGMTQGQGSQVNVVSTTPLQQSVTDGDMHTRDVLTFPTTTVRGFTGRPTNVPRRF